MLLPALAINAQQQPPGKIISGKVVSASGNLPVERATLSLLHQKKSFYTDASGNFSITLASSNDEVTISHVGFISKRILLLQNTPSPLIIPLFCWYVNIPFNIF